MILFNFMGIRVWFLLSDVFDLLPICAVVDKRIFWEHRGISPRVNLIEQINTLHSR